ncbi:NAD(P)/FAD-dependent oxidoreductase [Nocardioides sp. cx-169]|uniref:NAD(P)/FAD-dependent oxidoreductase n=1 Tax=Nocardioides sp. cx-169 TaxID=2899080 RepID=UPI001E55898F|nr:NAD(P)/FAD-dependent oxidoreductase [Nocardioides sp. cx-169]MCD4535411.1 NAD(P)/FAD-dependent oxidoreductase [Nocardioides sp. cx-169]
MRDLLIAGGGPVGLATALYAARAGLDVGVVEPRAGAIDKACGEGLMPGAVAALSDLGVALDGPEITGIRYLDGSRRAQAEFRHGPGRGVRRTRLHRAMSAAVLAAGVRTDPRAVREVVDCGDHLLVDGEPTRYLVAADGLHSPVRRMLGLDSPARRHRRYGQRCHVDLAPWTSLVEVHWSDAAEAYVTPVGQGRVGVAVLSEARRSFTDLLGGFPALTERLADVPLGPVRGAGPLRQRARRLAAGRVLLVGDAAGYVDALTGEGIALGLAQARAAVAALAGGDPTAYPRAAARIGRRHELLTQSLLAATRHRRVRRHLVPAAATWPRAFGAAVDQLARPA